jgi:hypothetical protein
LIYPIEIDLVHIARTSAAVAGGQDNKTTNASDAVCFIFFVSASIFDQGSRLYLFEVILIKHAKEVNDRQSKSTVKLTYTNPGSLSHVFIEIKVLNINLICTSLIHSCMLMRPSTSWAIALGRA